jgi:hypothetical protein
MSFRITSVYAAVAIGDDDEEGVCAVMVGAMWVPLLAADEARLPWIKEQALKVGEATGQRVDLIRLGSREHIETICAGRRLDG